MFSTLLLLGDYSYWFRNGLSLAGTIWMVVLLRGSVHPDWMKILLSIVYLCCWWWGDVATVFAIKAALYLRGTLHCDFHLVGAYYLIGIPVAEFICLVALRFLVSNYWNVLISFSAYIILVLLNIARDILRNGGHNLFRRIIRYVRGAAPLILQLPSFTNTIFTTLLFLLDGGRWSYSSVGNGLSLVVTIGMVVLCVKAVKFPLWLRISVTIVFSCCWWWDDVATILAVMAAVFLHGYFHVVLRLVGAYYLIGIPVAEFVCLVVLRFLVSNYWNVLISFAATIIVLLLITATRGIQRRGAGYNIIMDGLMLFVVRSAPSIFLLISFLLTHT